MEDFSKDLFEKLKEVCESCHAKTIALSGGLDSTILAYFLKEKKPRSISIIAKDFFADDLTYCQLVSQKFDLPLSILEVETSEILDGIEGTIKILQNFNDIEIRNNLVMFLAIKWVKEQGFNNIITGDGADELFAGYNFLVQKSESDLEKELERILNIMHFPTQKIGKSLGVSVESPYLDSKIIEYAQNLPSKFKVAAEKNKRFGKWILRKTFEKKIPYQIAWREKSPMEEGAGTRGLTHLFNVMIDEDLYLEKKAQIEEEFGIKIRSKESLHYFEIYRNLHPMHDRITEEKVSCPYCHFETKNSKFCRMCGAYPI